MNFGKHVTAGRGLLIRLLMAATVLVDLTLCTLAPPESSVWSDWFESMFMTLALSQIGLVAAWTGWGRTPMPWRLVGLTLALAGWAGMGAAVIRASGTNLERASMVAGFLTIYAVAVLVIILLARAWGLRSTTVAELTAKRDPVPRRPRFQFSLRNLFAWTTAVAVIVGGFRHLLGPASLRGILWHWTPATALFGGHAVLASVAVWTILGSRRPNERAAVLCATIGLVMLDDWNIPHAGVTDLLILVLVHPAWSLLSLAVVRVAGYRLVWRPWVNQSG